MAGSPIFENAKGQGEVVMSTVELTIHNNEHGDS